MTFMESHSMRPIQFLPVALLAGATVFSACAPGTTSTNPSGGQSQPTGQPKRIVTAIRGQPFTLSYAINTSSTGSVAGIDDIELLINPGLVALDNTNSAAAVLAETLPTVENGLWKVNADGTMDTTLQIRQGAAWHDATLITA